MLTEKITEGIMRYNQLGRTGILVSELCLGTMTYGDGGHGFWKEIGTLGIEETSKHFACAFEHGINFIDTANAYHRGVTEELVGKALKNSGRPRSEVVLATKARIRMGEGPNQAWLTRSHLIDELHASLNRLSTDYIDLYQIHGFDPLTPIEQTLRILNEFVVSGKVRYLGFCNLPAWYAMKANAFAEKMGWNRFESAQMYYSIAGRDIEREIVPFALDQGLSVLPWSPLAGGLLSGKYSRNSDAPEGSRRKAFDFPPVDLERGYSCIEVMQGIAHQHSVSVAQVALAWTVRQPSIASTIIGARTLDQLQDNIAATELALSSEDLYLLNEVSKLPAEYPGWMVERQSQDRL